MAEERSSQLLLRWQAGDAGAADELFRRYAERLIAVARRRLSSKLARRLDAEDVVQSAYRSFFASARDGRYDPQRGGDLWRLLVGLTLHKLHRQVRRHRAAKRAFEREVPLDEAGGLHGIAADLLARTPSPLEGATLAEQVERAMSRLRPVERQMFELRLQGYNLEEIAVTCQRSLRTVSRVLNEIKDSLRQAESEE
jgi:RNA polymerase sigma factor (sigma-70 family)